MPEVADHSTNAAMEKWRHLIEPEISSGLFAMSWAEALSVSAKVQELNESVLVTIDSVIGGANVRTIWVAAGNLPDVLELVSQSEEQAKSEGLRRVIYLGRRGWHRVAPGYRVEAVLGVKEL